VYLDLFRHDWRQLLESGKRHEWNSKPNGLPFLHSDLSGFDEFEFDSNMEGSARPLPEGECSADLRDVGLLYGSCTV